MGKSAADTRSKSAMAGIALIRLFLGLFFLFNASAKVDIAGWTTPDDTGGTLLMAPATARGSATNTPPVTSLPARQELIGVGHFAQGLATATAPGGEFDDPKDALPAYESFLNNVVSPAATNFAWVIIAGETLIGFLFLIGLFTRVTAFAAMLLNIAYLLATMHVEPPLGFAANAGFIMMEFAVLVGNAGKIGGVDALFGRAKGGES